MRPITSPEQNSAVALCQTLIAEIASQFNISVETLHSCLLREHNSLKDNSRPIQTGHKNESAGTEPITEEQGHRYINLTEVAFMLNIKPQTLRKWICHDKLPVGLPKPEKINGRNKWIRSDINAYFAKERLS